ncbi:hypothetical protein CVT26_007263 [Gymnopilus dilepis]|uniref:Uncharacterized protein n=1 Tax=Gymnopilus dilepis TaxID=231916 RepID=A0A409VM46_9AGAR|nr:hypothetical protein CVT26_007263 [Gymnopilus dilepis]
MARSHEKGKEDAGSFGHAYGWGVVRKGILESRVDKQMSRLVQEWQDSDPPFREYGQSKHRFRLSKQRSLGCAYIANDAYGCSDSLPSEGQRTNEGGTRDRRLDPSKKQEV